MDRRTQEMRRRIAVEAARLMAEEGVTSYFSAKQKAVARLGLDSKRNLPDNAEIEEALAEHQRLFAGEEGHSTIKKLRETALTAMRRFEKFTPRLVGSVLSGTANEHSAVMIHLFAQTPEEIGLLLFDERIPFEEDVKRVTATKSKTTEYPVFRFLAGDTTIELTVFPIDGIRQAPPSPVDGRPMQRASIAAVEKLLADSDAINTLANRDSA